MTPTTVLRCAAALLCALAAAACSGGSSSKAGSATPSPPSTSAVSVPSAAASGSAGTASAARTGTSTAMSNPCGLLTPAQIKAVVNWTPERGRKASAGLCFYSAPMSAAGGTGASVTINVIQGGKNMFDTLKLVKEGPEDLSGIGDAAYWAPGDHEVTFVKGQDIVSIGVADPTAAAQGKDRSIALAKDAAATL
jgi:hypothetical protein